MRDIKWVLVLGLLILAGCGFARGEHRWVATADLIPAKILKSKNEVQVFHGEARPKSGCLRVAEIQANGNGYATQDDLVSTLQQEAFALGADVVLVAHSGQTSMQVATYGGGIALANNVYFPYLAGVACRTASIWHGVRFDAKEATRWMVRYVYGGSPAEKAGIHEGDEIVTVNGTFLGDDFSAWDRHVNASKPRTAVDIQIIRLGIKQTVLMILEAPP